MQSPPLSSSNTSASAALHEATRALLRQKLRSGLAVLGVTVGIAAVICTVAVGEAAALQMREHLRLLGDNLVWIEAGSRTRDGVRLGTRQTKTLTLEDAEAIRTQVPLIKAVSPQVDGRVQVIHGDRNWNTGFRGESPDYFDIRRWTVARGARFSETDMALGANVCVLGKTVADQLFGARDPIGETIRVAHLACEVIGVLEPKGQSAVGQDQDDFVLLPFTTAQRKLAGKSWLDDINCSAVSAEAVPLATQQVSALLHQRHRLGPNEEDDFNVRHPEDVVKAQAEASRTYALWLAVIAAVSLLVGGVGIMNLMLVSVTERTREIGVRLAIGATAGQIQAQFLAEAVLLGLLGGGGGIAAGVAGAAGLAHLEGTPAVVSPQAIVVAALFATAVGVIFGLYPARRAARLDPIEALRHE